MSVPLKRNSALGRDTPIKLSFFLGCIVAKKGKKKPFPTVRGESLWSFRNGFLRPPSDTPFLDVAIEVISEKGRVSFSVLGV